jgi:hypothetical protein
MMMVRKNYNIRAVIAAFIGAGLVVAFLIHFIVLSSPKYNWIFPQTTTTAAIAPAPAPGAK